MPNFDSTGWYAQAEVHGRVVPRGCRKFFVTWAGLIPSFTPFFTSLPGAGAQGSPPAPSARGARFFVGRRSAWPMAHMRYHAPA